MSRPEFNEDHTPLGYLITFRAYGTWLHGDKRGSVDRNHHRYGSPTLPPSPRRKQIEKELLKQPPVKLNRRQRVATDSAVRKTCEVRKWNLWTVSVRTNHIHCVVTANCDPERVLNALKANATRKMKESGCWSSGLTPWARRGSKKYLWTEEDLVGAIVYAEEEQGEPLD